MLLAACYPPLPGSQGAAPASPSPKQPWTPPASAVAEGRESQLLGDTLPAGVDARRDSLRPEDLIDLALERNPDTRASWLTARAAAATYGEALGELFPEINGELQLTRQRLSAASSNAVISDSVTPAATTRTTYGPSISLSWLLFDFGGRAGAIDAARQEMFAANWTHNETLADLVRRTLQGYYAVVGARSLVAAERASLAEADTNLAATEERHNVGVATIADVLEARTAVAQARLSLDQAVVAADTAQAGLATLIGLPPDADFGVDTIAANSPVAEVTATVDTLMMRGLLQRPDLAAERATVDARRAEAREARSLFLPSLSATGTASDLQIAGRNALSPAYTLGLQVSIPIFNGFGWEYQARAANLTADAEQARLHGMEQQVALQVYQTYRELRTAAQNVATSEDLYQSASQSLDATLARYRQGVGTLIDLLTAESALASARAQRIAAHVDWHMALVQLAHDAGLLQPTGTTGLVLSPAPAPAASGNH